MNTHHLKFLTPLALGILMGCPPAENNDDSGDMNAMSDMGIQKDMPTDKEDMRIEKDMPDVKQDMPQDMPDTGEIDAPVDMPATCRLVGPPTTVALTDAADFATQAQLDCDAALLSEEMTLEFLGESRLLDVSTGEIKMECEPNEDLGSWCTVTLLNLPMPGLELPNRRGAHPLTLSSPTLNAVTIPVRFHTPFDEIIAASEPLSSIALPPNFARCGMDMTVRALDDGSPVMFSVMMNENNDGVVMSRHAPALGDPITQSVAVLADDLMASDFEVVRTPDGGFSAAWWGYDDTNDTFCGNTNHFKASGEQDGPGSTSCLATPVALKRILDVQWGLRAEGDAPPRVTARIMAITDEDRWVALRLFDGTGKVTLETDQNSTFLALPASEVTGGNTGFLHTRAKDTSPISTTKVWQTSPLPPSADDTPREGTLLTVITFAEDETIATLELPTDFPVEETFVWHSNTGKIFVLLLGATDEQALFETELTDLNTALAVPTLKTVPAKTGIARRKKTPFDRRKREAQLKRKLTPPRQGFAPHTLDLISEQGQTTALGRWPWDWRDRIQSKAEDQADMLPPSPLDIHAGRIDALPVMVSWIDGETDPKLVSPLVAEPLQANEALSLTQDTRAALMMTHDASRVLIATTALSPATCEAQGSCIQRLSGPRGPSIFLYPGSTRLSVVLGEGGSQAQDIPVTRPPTTVANVYAAMENPVFQGQAGANQNVLAAIAPVDDPTRPNATHAVWSMAPDGSISGPGFVQFTTGNPKLGLTKASVFEAISLNVTLDGAGEPEVIAHAVVTQRYRDEVYAEAYGREALVQVNQDALLAAIGVDDVMNVDLSAYPPIFIDDPSTPPGTYKGESFFLPSIDESKSELSARIEAIRDPETSLPATYTTYNVSTKDRRTSALVLISHNGEGNMADYLRNVRPPGVDEGEALEAVMEAMPDDGSEVVLGFGDFVGDGTQQAVTAELPDRTSEDPVTINVYTMRTRPSVTKRQERIRASYKQRLQSEEVRAAPMTRGDFAAGMSIRIDDFNGDGVDDLAMTSGVIGSRRHPTQVLLGDGQGGFLADQVWLSGPPASVCEEGTCAKAQGRERRGVDPDTCVLTTHVCHF
jgi:hypothetical protein